MPTRAAAAANVALRHRHRAPRLLTRKEEEMSEPTSIHRPGSLAALAAEGRARIERDQVEFDREDGIVRGTPPEDELAAKRAKRDQIRGGA
jgi:hypothetical protein